MSNNKLYRNKMGLLTEDKVEIDPGALWQLIGKNLVLVDDDTYITAKLDLSLFEIVE